MKANQLLTVLSTILFVGMMNAQAPEEIKKAVGKLKSSEVPDSYDFSWKYTMETASMTGKTMVTDYLLEKNADYFGMSITQAGGNTMLMIMDAKKKVALTAFNKDGKKIALARSMKDPEVAVEKKTDEKKFTYKSLPDKKILGYKCKGIEAVCTEYTAVFYFTNDAPVNFADLFKSQKGQKIPEVFKDYFKPEDKPLMMTVDITYTADKKTVHTKCTALEKSKYTFNKADYKFM